jgi:hypothetical protein
MLSLFLKLLVTLQEAKAINDFQMAAKLGFTRAQDYLETEGISWEE